jgi:hypothetical protein
MAIFFLVLVLDLARTGLAGARCAGRISGSSRTLERKAFEDEDSLPDVSLGARRLAALAVSEVGTTKDDDDLVAAAPRKRGALHGLSPHAICFVTRSRTNESATLGLLVPDSPEGKTAKNSPVSLWLLRSIVTRVKPKSVSL